MHRKRKLLGRDFGTSANALLAAALLAFSGGCGMRACQELTCTGASAPLAICGSGGGELCQTVEREKRLAGPHWLAQCRLGWRQWRHGAGSAVVEEEFVAPPAPRFHPVPTRPVFSPLEFEAPAGAEMAPQSIAPELVDPGKIAPVPMPPKEEVPAPGKEAAPEKEPESKPKPGANPEAGVAPADPLNGASTPQLLPRTLLPRTQTPKAVATKPSLAAPKLTSPKLTAARSAPQTDLSRSQIPDAPLPTAPLSEATPQPVWKPRR